MIVASDIELRAGARLLIEGASFRANPGDKIGLVGRNGAGKTTLTRVLAGEGSAASGTVSITGEVGYLPQDPRTGDLHVLARDRILSARGLDQVLRELREAETGMSSADNRTRDRAVRAYGRLEDRLHVLGGYAAESEAASIASSLGLPDRVLGQPLETLSGGQRRRVELARILFSGAETLLLDEPTNHLDADSIGWLRDFLRSHQGGLIIISHDVSLLEATVNRVLHLDANRAVIDTYNVGWKSYLAQRETDEKRRRRERANAEKQASALMSQADKMRAKATKAKAAQDMQRRAERLLSGLEVERRSDKVANCASPSPPRAGAPRSWRRGCRSRTAPWRSSPTSTPPSTGEQGRHPRPERRGEDHSPADSRRHRGARHRRGQAGTRAQAGLLRAGARDDRPRAHRAGEHALGRGRASRRGAAQGPRARSCSPATTWTSPRGCCRAGRRRGWPWPRWCCPRPTSSFSTNPRTTLIRPAGSRYFRP